MQFRSTPHNPPAEAIAAYTYQERLLTQELSNQDYSLTGFATWHLGNLSGAGTSQAMQCAGPLYVMGGKALDSSQRSFMNKVFSTIPMHSQLRLQFELFVLSTRYLLQLDGQAPLPRLHRQNQSAVRQGAQCGCTSN